MPFNYSEGIFEALPVEIWNLIIEFLRQDSWSSLHALNLCCSTFHELVVPVLFKKVHIYFPKYGEATGHLKLDALLSPDLGRCVCHHVRIFIVSYGHTLKKEYSEMIYALVERLPNLQTIRWCLMPFPAGLLSNLMSRHSPPVFHYEGDPENFEGINDRVAPFIKSASLTFPAPSVRHPLPDPHFIAFRNLLPSLPNLRRLALKYRFPGPERSRPILDLPPGSTLASVEDLALANFSFSAGQAASWIRSLEAGTRLRRLSLHGSALDLYEFIHQLSTSGIPGGLTSLSLRVHNSSLQTSPQLSEALISLLRRTTNLAEFLAYDLPKDVLHTVVSSHGGNIRRLGFRRTNYRA
ncbi:hypothetical protein BJY00DRAFT_293533 [Aspergillus carlsbadensis]|nr:hypothetical protein BJY00DRAFT_293533 [Aspergillus carlsbadensis]